MIQGKAALITGGSKGIGYSIAEAMLQEGINVGITSRSESAAQEAAQQLNGLATSRAEAIGIVADVRNYDAQQQAVQQVLNKFGQLDIVIANAGVGHFAPIEDLTAKQWQDTIDINLTGVFYTIKSALDALTQSQGYFMTIASLAGTNFFAKGAAYNASKFGLVGFTQAVMLDVRSKGIKTTTIMPGSVSTYFNNHIPNEADAWKIQPEDIGQMVIDLLKMPARTLPSKIEVRPSQPSKK